MNRILCVDDEPHMLDSLACSLGLSFEVLTANGGPAGLDLLQNSGPFAVVISDMRMPNMSGATFLAKVREIAPDSIRIILTGHADIHTAVAAVNDGWVFKFLTKPINPIRLIGTVREAMEQYQIAVARSESMKGSGRVRNMEDMLKRFALDLMAAGITTPIGGAPPESKDMAALRDLSPRESEILKLFMQGLRVAGIADSLFISQNTVRNHLKSIFKKVDVRNQSELMQRLRPATP